MALDREPQTFAARGLARLPSEDVVISAPMSYTGSAQRIVKLRRHARDDRELAALTVATITLTAVAWAIITVWYLMWGLLLIPYRVMRRRARQRRVAELRHRELLEARHGPVAEPVPPGAPVHIPGERVADVDREVTAATLRDHMLVGRLDTDEFEERLEAAHRARTWADLDALLADLPRDPPRRPAPVRGPDRARPPRWPDPDPTAPRY